jgi:hypothetical protein
MPAFSKEAGKSYGLLMAMDLGTDVVAGAHYLDGAPLPPPWPCQRVGALAISCLWDKMEGNVLSPPPPPPCTCMYMCACVFLPSPGTNLFLQWHPNHLFFEVTSSGQEGDRPQAGL